MELVISIIALVMSFLVATVVYIKLKSIYINLYNLSKGLDILFANQDKILELTRLKTFVQLTTEEELNVREEIKKEKPTFANQSKESIRSSESDKDDKKS